MGKTSETVSYSGGISTFTVFYTICVAIVVQLKRNLLLSFLTINLNDKRI